MLHTLLVALIVVVVDRTGWLQLLDLDKVALDRLEQASFGEHEESHHEMMDQGGIVETVDQCVEE